MNKSQSKYKIHEHFPRESNTLSRNGSRNLSQSKEQYTTTKPYASNYEQNMQNRPHNTSTSSYNNRTTQSQLWQHAHPS